MQNYKNLRAWYIISTFNYNEQKVYSSLKAKINSLNLKDYIFNIILPKKEVITTNKKGEQVTKDEWLYRSYVYIEMIPTDQVLFTIKNTYGVIGILGDGGKNPIPVPEKEMKQLFISLDIEDNILSVNDQVEVVNGPFEGNVGTIKAINNDNIDIALINSQITYQTQNSNLIKL